MERERKSLLSSLGGQIGRKGVAESEREAFGLPLTIIVVVGPETTPHTSFSTSLSFTSWNTVLCDVNSSEEILHTVKHFQTHSFLSPPSSSLSHYLSLFIHFL